jgi:uroporphyrinogen decarboxylase
VIGVDWRVPLDVAWERVGHDRGIQGNLDGAVLLGPWERAAAGARDVLECAGGRPGHIFNLGHGVLPETDPELLGRLVQLVHETTMVPTETPLAASTQDGRALPARPSEMTGRHDRVS